MSKTIAIIPARGGSNRLPGKNIKLLGGIPLLAHSILYAKQHDFINEVYVSTDDDAIKKVALESKIINHIKKSDYKKITIDIANGNIVNFEDTEKIKL